MAEPAVVDTSPLVVLSRADQVHLLQMSAQDVVLPAAVHREVAAYGPEDPTFKAISVTPWLHVVASPPLTRSIVSLDLGRGESEIIAWALAHQRCEAIIDDLTARRHAVSLGIMVVGTVGLVLRAKQRGIYPQCRPVLESLRQSELYLSDSVLDQALARVSE